MKRRLPATIAVHFQMLVQKVGVSLQQAECLSKQMPLAIVLSSVALSTLLIQGYRLDKAPDIFSDEGAYLLAGSNLAKGLGLVVNQQLFLWHPPGYMLIEAFYLRLTGIVNADPLTMLLMTRWLNIYFSALTAILLVLFGRKLYSYKAGLIAATLFLMDPYIQRINRRNMLETLAMLSVLIGMYLFFSHQSRLTVRRRLGVGAAFGVAVLTKEPMFCQLLAFVVIVLWLRRDLIRDMVWVMVIACAIYALYPLWMMITYQGHAYMINKYFGLSRITHLFLPSPTPSAMPASSAKTNLLENIWDRFSLYGTSYVLITLAALFTVFLILCFRSRLEARFLILWSIFSFGFGLALGKVSDQYFYYLIVPATIVIGYGTAVLFGPGIPSRLRLLRKPAITLLCVLFLFNSSIWARTYIFGSDNAYMEIIRYIQANIPHNEIIEASDDVAVYYLSPPYVVRLDRHPETIMKAGARYFILSDKDAQGGYNAMTPELYSWVIQNSRPLLEREYLSFGKIGLYQLKTRAMLNVKGVSAIHENNQKSRCSV